MQKVLFVFLSLIFNLGFLAIGQNFVGSNQLKDINIPEYQRYCFDFKPIFGSNTICSEKKNALIINDKALRSGIYLRFGFLFDPTGSINKNDGLYDGTFSSFGFCTQFGTYFYFGPTILQKIRIGLDVTWLNYSFILPSDDYITGIKFHFLEFGPLFSFSPYRNVGMDCSFKISPTTEYLLYNDDNFTRSAFGFNFLNTIGVVFRYSILSVGCEYNFGKMKYIGDDEVKYSGIECGSLWVLFGLKF